MSELEAERIVNGKKYVGPDTQRVCELFPESRRSTLPFIEWLYRSMRILVWEDVPMFYKCFTIFRKVIRTTDKDVLNWLNEQADDFIKEYKSDSSYSMLIIPFYACLLGHKLSNEATGNDSGIVPLVRKIIDIEKDILFVTKIPYFKNEIQLIWPDYSSKEILEGDFSNERNMKIFYGLNNDNLLDALEVPENGESGTNEVNEYFDEVTYTRGFNTTQTKLFYSAYTEMLVAYRDLVKCNSAQTIQDSLDILPARVSCSIESTLNYCLNALKMIISSRNAFGNRWTEIANSLNDVDYLFEIADTFDNLNVRNLLYGYYHLTEARNDLLLFDMRLEHSSCQQYTDIINAIIKEHNDNHIQHHFQTATEDTIPQETKEWRDAMMEFAATIKTYLTME